MSQRRSRPAGPPPSGLLADERRAYEQAAVVSMKHFGYNLIYFNEVDKGGHFAAWEQPRLFSEEVRAAFRSLR